MRVLSRPTVEHLSESGFPHLSQWNKKPSDLIENPVGSWREESGRLRWREPDA